MARLDNKDVSTLFRNRMLFGLLQTLTWKRYIESTALPESRSGRYVDVKMVLATFV